MKIKIPVLAFLFIFILARPVHADSGHVWIVASPDHAQTFTYGTEKDRIWTVRGRDRHLALLLNFTNDPYVDRDDPRQYDYFTFNFPGVTLGRDGETFFYLPMKGRPVPVARKRPGLFGIGEISLLLSSSIVVKKPHGYLSVTLVIDGRGF